MSAYTEQAREEIAIRRDEREKVGRRLVKAERLLSEVEKITSLDKPWGGLLEHIKVFNRNES